MSKNFLIPVETLNSFIGIDEYKVKMLFFLMGAYIAFIIQLLTTVKIYKNYRFINLNFLRLKVIKSKFL